MNSFKEHALNPKSFEVMPHPHTHAKYTHEEKKFEIFLNINSSDKITGFTFQAEGLEELHPYASALSEIAWGKSITDALKISMSDFIEFFQNDETFNALKDENDIPFFNPVLTTFKEALRDYSGRNYFNFNEGDSKETICRCFGTKKSEIISYFKGDTIHTLKEFFSTLKAGSGCSTCLSDIQELSLELNSVALKKDSAPEKIIDWESWHTKINKAISTYKKMMSLELGVELEYLGVQGLKGHIRVHIDSKDGNLSEKITETLLNFLSKNFGEDFYFFLVS